MLGFCCIDSIKEIAVTHPSLPRHCRTPGHLFRNSSIYSNRQLVQEPHQLSRILADVFCPRNEMDIHTLICIPSHLLAQLNSSPDYTEEKSGRLPRSIPELPRRHYESNFARRLDSFYQRDISRDTSALSSYFSHFIVSSAPPTI